LRVFFVGASAGAASAVAKIRVAKVSAVFMVATSADPTVGFRYSINA
jgi:hypothetical protein